MTTAAIQRWCPGRPTSTHGIRAVRPVTRAESEEQWAADGDLQRVFALGRGNGSTVPRPTRAAVDRKPFGWSRPRYLPRLVVRPGHGRGTRRAEQGRLRQPRPGAERADR